MGCSYMIPGKGHQKAKLCNALEHKDGLCISHQPKPVSVAVTPVTPTWQPKPSSGTTVNAKFQTECDGAATRIEAVCLNGIHAGGMSFTGSKGAHQLLHDTQPHANAVFFYRWVGSVMEVYGVGSHSGSADNKHYALTWYDGSNAAVDLGKKKIT